MLLISGGLLKTIRADDRRRYTATIPRHRAVQQNTPRFLTPIRDADWSTQPRTGFDTKLLAVHGTAASHLGPHRFLARPITLSVAKYTMRNDFAPGSSRPIAFQFPTESQPWAQRRVAAIERRAFIFLHISDSFRSLLFFGGGFHTHVLSSFGTSRGHRCRPLFPPALAFNFYRA